MFKIGDRVRVIKYYCGAKKGDEGIIRGLPGHNSSPGSHADHFAIDFPSWSDGHSCNGIVPSGHGLWVIPECFELIKPTEKIVITHDGKTTLARLYENNKVVKSAEAKCDPKDEFKFIEGAKIAFERLTEDKAKFDKSMLTTGRFGYMEKYGWFVVVGEDIVYENGGYDHIRVMNDQGVYNSAYGVKYVVESEAFNYAKGDYVKVIWCAPDFDPKKVK